MSKLMTLAEAFGYDDPFDMILIECDYMNTHPGHPGICTNDGCDYVVSDCDPDTSEGYCPKCKSKSIESALVIARMI